VIEHQEEINESQIQRYKSADKDDFDDMESVLSLKPEKLDVSDYL
jgi:hypothetical protein